MIIDGKDASLTFNGDLVGHIKQFDLTDAITTVRSFADLDGNVKTLPNGFTRGELIVTLLRSTTDVGQIAMQTAQAAPPYGAIEQCVLTLNDGSTLTFDAFVKRFPYIGSENNTNPARAVLQIASDVI